MIQDKKTNLYELVLIISQYAEIDSVLNGVQDDINQKTINEQQIFFSLMKKEFWGKRNLAYKINKIKKADYHVVYFESSAEVLKLIERKLKMNQDVIRFLFLKIKEMPISNPPIMAGLLTSENVEAMNKKLSESETKNGSQNSNEELSDEENQELALNWISYKNPDLLLRYISDIYMISSRKFNGLTALQQRTLKTEIARARFLAILPFTVIRRK